MHTNIAKSRLILQYCNENGIPFAGGIPFDDEAVQAINRGITIVDVDCKSGLAVKEVYNNVMPLLFKDGDYEN